MTQGSPSTTVVVLAFGAEPYLLECVSAVLSDMGERDQLLVVDNGAASAVEGLPIDPRLQILHPESNLGFAGGCNFAAARATGEVLVLVNSDAIVTPGSLARLVAGLNDSSIGIVSGGVRLAQEPELMNSVGNPIHYLGVVWAGGYGDRAEAHVAVEDVASASGAFLAIRQDRWDELGGFAPEYFAYHEDTDLSLQAWERGWRVVFEPAAVVHHHYEFSRNSRKQYLLERNRWLTVLTVYPTSVLRVVLPAMVLFEVPLVAVSLVQGWFPQKVRGWIWLILRINWIRSRRTEVQNERVMSGRSFADLLSQRIEPAMIERPPGLGVINGVLAAYWSVARRLIH